MQRYRKQMLLALTNLVSQPHRLTRKTVVEASPVARKAKADDPNRVVRKKAKRVFVILGRTPESVRERVRELARVIIRKTALHQETAEGETGVGVSQEDEGRLLHLAVGEEEASRKATNLLFAVFTNKDIARKARTVITVTPIPPSPL